MKILEGLVKKFLNKITKATCLERLELKLIYMSTFIVQIYFCNEYRYCWLEDIERDCYRVFLRGGQVSVQFT